jgi:hypothetical protein
MEEILLIALVTLGSVGGFASGGNDLVSLLPTDTYFQSRRIPLNIENLETLARTEPKDGKTQVKQLMALRALAENPELIRKGPDTVLRTIEKIARGELAHDRLGFSQEYARRTLFAVGSPLRARPKPPKAGPPADFAADALGWFPASSTLVGFIGGSPGAVTTNDHSKEVRKLLGKLVRRPRDWNEFFNGIEMVGNARIDRISFAYSSKDKQKGKDRLFIRISGLGDHQRIVAALKAATKGTSAWKEDKDALGIPITTVQERNSPAVAFIGDTDLVIGSYTSGFGGGDATNQLEVIEHLFAIRAGKKESVLKGALLEGQPQLSPRTVGLLLGELPQELRQALRTFATFERLPKSVRLQLLRAKGGMDVRFQAVLPDAHEARNFAKSLAGLRQAGLDGLKQIAEAKKGETPVPRHVIAASGKALESLKVQADGFRVKGELSIPSEALLAPLWLQLRFLGAMPEPVPPPTVVPEPKEVQLWRGHAILG